MTNWPTYVRELRSARGERQHQFAAAVGVSQATVSRWEKGRNKPSRDEARTLAELAERSEVEMPASQPKTAVAAPVSQSEDDIRQTTMTLGLPILGRRESGNDVLILDRDQPQAFTARPGFLAGATNGYAVYMPDETMEPRYFLGELLYVDPAIPAKTGDFVVTLSDAGGAIIARYERRNDQSVVIKTLNPPSEMTFPLRQVKLHCIVGTLTVRP